MAISEENEPSKIEQSPPPENLPLADSLKFPNESFRDQWTRWALDTSKDLQPILKETTIFAVFILGDLFIIWLAGFAFADIIEKIHTLEWVYDGIKTASVIVITFHYLANCTIEIYKNKKNLSSEILPKAKKKVDAI